MRSNEPDGLEDFRLVVDESGAGVKVQRGVRQLSLGRSSSLCIFKESCE